MITKTTTNQAKYSNIDIMVPLLRNKHLDCKKAQPQICMSVGEDCQSVSVPEVYNVRCLALKIDDFCLKSENFWKYTGTQLIKEIKPRTTNRDAAQIFVLYEIHNHLKREFLINQNLFIDSKCAIRQIM